MPADHHSFPSTSQTGTMLFHALLGALNLLFLFACVLLLFTATDPHEWTILILINLLIMSSPLALIVGAVIGALLSRKKGKRSIWGFGRPALTAASLLAAGSLWMLTGYLQHKAITESRSTSPYPAMSFQQLAAVTKGPDSLARILAAHELVNRNLPGTADLIRPMLKDPGPDHRMQIVRLLGLLKDTESVDPIIQCMEGDVDGVVIEAINSLGSIGDLRAKNHLIHLLNDPRFGVLAAEALGRMGNNDVAGPLIEALQRAVDRESPDDAARIAKALRRLTGRTFDQDPGEWQRWWQTHIHP